jgi:hypothetical protein
MLVTTKQQERDTLLIGGIKKQPLELMISFETAKWEPYIFWLLQFIIEDENGKNFCSTSLKQRNGTPSFSAS